MRTYVSGGNALPYIVNNEQLGGLIYDPNSGAFVSLPVVATDSAPAMVDTSAVLSASFLGNSGSVIQALNYLRAASDASNDAAGSTTQVQYNDSGEFGASSGLVFASNTLTLDVGGVSAVSLTASGGALTVGTTEVLEADIAKIDGITNGAGAAAKALVLDANADIASGLRSLTGSGDVFFVNGHYSGDVRAKIGDFTSLDLNSGGITDAGAIAGASTIVATGQASVATLSVASDDFVVDGSGNVTSVGSINMTGDITGSSYRTNRTLMTGSGQGTVLRAYGTIMNNMTPIAVGDSAAEAQINDIPHIQIMGTDSGGLLQEFKFQVSGGILQVNQV